jgi:putative ABC transport system ATP-binding protein
MIVCDAITKTYKNTLTVLSNIDLQVGKGDRVSIMGPSGSGKSTLLRLMAGLEDPTTGTVRVNDQNLKSLSDDDRSQLRATTFGFVFQSFRLFSPLTARENVELGLWLMGVHDSKDIARDWLDRVGLGDREHHYPHELSGGEMQRVAIARALAPNPPIIIADEPTGNLDHAHSERIQRLFFDCLDNRSAGLIMVTHDPKLAAMCSTRYRLDHGTLVPE